MGRRMRRWWCGGVSYNLRESFILTCCTGFSPRKIHHSMGGPLLLHSDTTRSGSNILTSRTKWPEECSPRGAFLSVPAVPAARMQNFNKSYKHRINTKSFIHNGGRWIINPQLPAGDFFVGKTSILEESWIYMPLFDKMYSIFRQPPPILQHSRDNTVILSGTGVSDWSHLQLQAAKSVLRKAWGYSRA